GHQREEDRKKRGQGVEGLIRAGRDDVLLAEHLDHIGDAVERSQQPKTKDVGAVGADPVLEEGGLLPLHPGMKPRQVQSREKDDAGQDDLDCQNFDHDLTAPGAGLAGGASAPGPGWAAGAAPGAGWAAGAAAPAAGGAAGAAAPGARWAAGVAPPGAGFATLTPRPPIVS